MAFGDFTVDRNSTKYVLGSSGTIVSYPTDEPAFEFNADGTYKGLLVEPAATNLLTYSEDLSNAIWIARGFTKVGSTTGPFGMNGFEFLEDNTDSNPAIYHNTDVTDGTPRTFGVWLKASTPVTMALSTQGGTKSTDISITTEWQFYSVSDSINTAIGPHIGGFNTITQGSGIRLYVAMPQQEAGPIATSYIPTAGSTVTRLKDDITQTGAQSLIGQTEGTLYLEVDWRVTSGTTQILYEVSDGTFNNRIVIYNRNSPIELRMFANANGANLTNQGVSSTGYSGIQKLAFAYAENDLELYRNGSSISSDTVGSLAALATLTDIDLGQNYAATEQANMHIRAVAIYPTRLSDAECEALTTL